MQPQPIRLSAIVFFLLLVPLAVPARADFVAYRVPRLPGLVALLEGKVIVNPGRTVTLQHRLGKIYMSRDDIEKIYNVDDFAVLFGRKLSKAKDAEAAMEAARWALKHGLLTQFYIGVEKALQLDPQHADALKVLQLREKLKQPLGSAQTEEAALRALVRNPGMKVELSDHFILLHDTPPTVPKNLNRNAKDRKPRAQERLELLEQVYESFLLRFYSQGVTLDVPQERLKVVLFNDERDYLRFATDLSPDLSSAIGFFQPDINISFFYDHTTSERFQTLRTLSAVLTAQYDEAFRNKDKDTIQLADTISLLVAIEQENADIEVVSHEATHQLAANTGLLPRQVRIPQWVHEGLATYFEAPDDATWSGMGAVNEQRLERYRYLLPDRVHSRIDFIVGDEIFKYAASHDGVLFGYGQAWALTHFLLERHFAEFLAYYRRLGEMPPDIIMSPQVLTMLFDDTFQSDRNTLDAEWHAYMRTLRTDLEIILSEADKSR